MRVITGYSSKSDGLLIITEKSLAEAAAAIGLRYVVLNVHNSLYKGEVHLFVAPDVSDAALRGFAASEEFIGICEWGRGVWQVCAAEVVLDVNLRDAVQW